MESDPANLAKILSGAIPKKHVVEAIITSIMTLQLYDWLLLLPHEVEYIWRSSWSLSKALYLLTRYTPFVTVALVLRNQFASNPTPEPCKRIAQATVWLSFLGLAFAEAVLIIRTYAVWKQDKRVGIGLAFLFIPCQVATGVLTAKWIGTVTFLHNPYPEIIRGCAYGGGSRIVFAGWVILTVEEGVNLALMIISAVDTYRERTSNLMNVVYRDGIRFYVYIFCVTLVNVLATLLLPVDFVGVGSVVEIVLHSILACRLMIAMREAGRSLGYQSESFELLEVSRSNAFESVRRPLIENTSMDSEPCAGPSKT